MVKITFIEASGSEIAVDAKPGQTLMEAATRGGVGGIVAECGGNCVCGTCRIYPEADWADRLGAMSAIEQEMLDCTEDPEPGVRLSCRIVVTEALDGLVVRLPESQY